ncbi:M28 family peptidase [Pontibacter vulgaris]|uniref:M28 family peptidase n=1 Tax=Pontibacter vulgaris TaxID=2905679 RepID=UPI001FA6B527|nr:M28 family peptidase [Pontibacter vulgaris]
MLIYKGNMKASPDRLYNDVETLTSISPPRNYLQLESLNKAATYIISEFRKLNCQVKEQPFQVDGNPYKNITAIFEGRSAERIVVGAHYDVCGDQPGADDNASGVAGLLEIARLLNERQNELTHTIELVAYCLEEPPYFGSSNMGSAVHARSLKEAGVQVKAMICYDMIGYYSDTPGSQRFPSPEFSKYYPDTGNFIVVVSRQGDEAFTQKVRDLMQPHCQVPVYAVNLPEAFGLVGLSDHRNYWKYNIDAVMINNSAFLRNPNYHLPTDTIDTLDFDKMAEVVNGVYNAIIRL